MHRLPRLLRLPRLPRLATGILLLAAAALLPAELAAQRRADPLRGLDTHITSAMRAWEVPGLAIAVVRNDRIVYARGFGVRSIATAERVDTATLFAIASVTKSFTAALTAMLVDEGKVRWSDAASQHLPGLQLADPYVTRELTVGDLLSHRSGLPRGDMLWYASERDRAEVLRRVRFLQPASSLRSSYGYQNIMYIAAGEMIAAAEGKPWDDVVRERIFHRLGMRATNTSVRAFSAGGNVAQPHVRLDDTVRVIPYRPVDNVGSAGSINSSVSDMAQWVRFQLRRGSWPDTSGGRDARLISRRAFAEMHTPHTIVRIDSATRALNPHTHLRTVGLGWFLQDYRGRLNAYHGGNLDGMSALISLLPDEHVGLIILTNMGGSGLPTAIAYDVFDRILGERGKDWSGEMLAATRRRMEVADSTRRRRDAERVAGTSPSLALERYAGTYVDSLYGEVRIEVQDAKLVARFGPAYVGDLEHWHYDTFRAHWRDRSLGRQFVGFRLDFAGRPSMLVMEGLGEFRLRPERDRPATAATGEGGTP